MLIHAHVLVVDGYDEIALTGKQRMFEVQAAAMAERGLARAASSPEVFHYSVDYQPSVPDAGFLYIVNDGPWAVCAFDRPDRAVRAAEARMVAGHEATTVTRVRLDRTGETAFETRRLLAACR